MNTILVVLDAVANSLWQVVAVAALVWLALRFALRTNAATRHAIWWATLGVVLVLPVAPHLTLTMRPNPHPVAVTVVKTPKVAAATVIAEPVMVTVAPGRAAIWPVAIFAVWAAILLWRMFQIGRSYFYLRGVKRRAIVSPIPLPAIPRRANLLISPEVVSPMAVGFLRPAVILSEALRDELSEPEYEHVLLHEAAHLARFDDWSNLAMRIMGGALALHPVAIWILRRIEREREMACDDWVVARTGAARPYAASLARLFELRQMRRGEMLASGFFGRGSRISDRIELLLRHGRTFSPRASVRGITASTVVLAGLALAGSLAPRWIAFAQTPARPSFEVASVKPGDPDNRQSGYRQQPGGRYIATNVSLKNLISSAYGVSDPRMSGGPNWLGSDRFTIEAKAAAPLPPWPESNTQLSLMLQSLLENRFKLAVHWETKEVAVYDLVVAKGGPRLKRADAAESSGSVMEQGRVRSLALPLGYLASNLASLLGRPVIDKTGLAGKYDYMLTYTPDDAPPTDANGPSIFTAVQEQLGLKLESAKGPVEFLVIDHAEKPDAN